MSLLRLLTSLLSIFLVTAAAQAQEGCGADADGDGVVNGTDLAIVLGNWGPCAGCAADLNANGQVNGEDLAVALTRWGSTCPPAVNSMSVSAGPLAGGTSVTINGDRLLNPTSVTFGGTPAVITANTRNTVTVMAPARRAGSASVVVYTAGGSVAAGAFEYYGAPTITTLAPNTGSVAGGSLVSVSGSSFYGVPGVFFGGAAASSVTVVSPTQLTAIAPPGAVDSTVAVSVSTLSGNATLPSAFSYVAVVVPSWATLLEATPNPLIVTSESLRNAISATGYAWRVRDNSTNIEFVLIPPGSFSMGCSASDNFPCYDAENPVHTVELSAPYYLGRFEVTQAQWQARMGSNPSYFTQASSVVSIGQVPQRPVERVSWNAVQTFLNGTGCRLPTEAEWEYASRAGSTAPYHAGPGFPNGTATESSLVHIAWWNSVSALQTHPVGGKAANPLGLYDMHGNVWEWVNDWFSASYYASSPPSDPMGPKSGMMRVLRGGCWYDHAGDLRASSRFVYEPESSHYGYGFRVARNP